MATEGLTAHHQDEIKKYLKFFRGKLELHLDVLEGDFEDTRTDRLTAEDMYTQDEVQEVMGSLCDAIKSSVRSEFQASTNMTALLLRQLFREADNESVRLELDTSVVEDRSLLDKVQRLSVDTPSTESSEVANIRATKKLSRMDEEYKELEIKTKALAEENHKLQSKLEESIRELQLAEKNNISLKHLIEELKVSNETNDNSSNDKVRELEKKLKSSTRKLREKDKLVNEAALSVTQSKQFQQLKAMLGQKNDQLRELRSRLLKYEPDTDDYTNERKADSRSILNSDDDDEFSSDAKY